MAAVHTHYICIQGKKLLTYNLQLQVISGHRLEYVVTFSYQIFKVVAGTWKNVITVCLLLFVMPNDNIRNEDLD